MMILRRVKKSQQISTFEYLPNELILTIFEYLYCHDIIYAFNQLNSRFQFLLHTHEYYHLNFDHIIMKSIFNLIQQLPINIQHIKSLTLSNNMDHSCLNIEECLLIYPIELFYPKLQSLSLLGNDNNQLISLIFLLPNFQQLKYVLISKNTFGVNDDIIRQIRHIILFEIKALKHLTWDIPGSGLFQRKDNTLSIQKSHIEYYEFREMNFDDLPWLNFHTINMKSLNIHHPSPSHFSHPQEQIFERLISIKLNIKDRSLQDIYFLFKHLTPMTQLRQLEVISDVWSIENYIDGYIWESCIQKYLPQLRIFKFLFTFFTGTISKPISELIKPFMTDFWLIEKKWFVSCHHHEGHRVYLYTIPYMSSELKYTLSCQRISTGTKNDTLNIKKLFFERVYTRNLVFNDFFLNVQSLTVGSIFDNITYNQMNTFLNMSSLKHIIFQSDINSKLFFDILKYNPRQISFEIDYFYLIKILEPAKYYRRYQIIFQLKKIKRLTLRRRSTFNLSTTYIPLIEKEIRKICYLFSNIEQLIIEGAIESIELLLLLLRKLKHLSFVSVYSSNLKYISPDTIQQRLNNQSRTKLNDKTFTHQSSENKFYVWIDQ